MKYMTVDEHCRYSTATESKQNYIFVYPTRGWSRTYFRLCDATNPKTRPWILVAFNTYPYLPDFSVVDPDGIIWQCLAMLANELQFPQAALVCNGRVPVLDKTENNTKWCQTVREVVASIGDE